MMIESTSFLKSKIAWALLVLTTLAVAVPVRAQGQSPGAVIPVGTTGQADYVSSEDDKNFTPPLGWNVLISGISVATNLQPNGWAVTPDGQITVPADAVPGEYTVEICEPSPNQSSSCSPASTSPCETASSKPALPNAATDAAAP